jgi:hypothetical protein
MVPMARQPRTRPSASPAVVEVMDADLLPARTLGLLVERLHPAVVDVLAAPAGMGATIADPVILDAADVSPLPVDSVVLAVGVEGTRARVSLVQQLADKGAAAVVVKNEGAVDEQLVAAAEAAGIALLAAPVALSWGQLYSLMLTASSAAPVMSAETNEVPLGDLFALANAVAAMVGGATTIEDPQNRILAYSNLDHPIDPPRQATILGRAVPSEWIRRLHDVGVFRRLWQTDEVIRISEFVDEPEYLPRLAIAVRAGGELLGSIWVIEGHQPLGPEAERTLREASRIASLHLLRHRSASDVERQKRSEALLALLEGRDRGQRARELLGIDGHRPVAVLAFDVGGDGGAEAVMAAARVADLVAVYCESFRRQAACAATGSRVYALVPTDADGGDEPLAGLARAVVERARQALRLSLTAGIGATVFGLDEVSASRRDADHVLDVLTAGPGPHVAAIDEVRSQVIIRRLRQLAGEHPELRAGRLAALSEQDADKGTAWVATLRAYFDAFGDMAVAAARVNVHPNTFRYRLRRIVELFDIDLDNPDERLVTELQLRFLDTP